MAWGAAAVEDLCGGAFPVGGFLAGVSIPVPSAVGALVAVTELGVAFVAEPSASGTPLAAHVFVWLWVFLSHAEARPDVIGQELFRIWLCQLRGVYLVLLDGGSVVGVGLPEV